MYELNHLDKDNLDHLANKELIQICVGLYQIILRFTEELNITIECLYCLSDNQTTVEATGDDPHASKNLVCLLGASIHSAQILGSSEVLIYFSNGYYLKLVANSAETESFSITDGTFEILA